MKHYKFTLNHHDDPPMLEYDKKLGEALNLERKGTLIKHGLDLTWRGLINDAIIYYKYLTNNTYFTHDYYPYRQLSIIYHRNGDYMAGLVNIKRLFHANIYLNNYQFIFFTERLRQLISEGIVSEFEVEEWIGHYQFHGALREKNQNPYLADRFIFTGNDVVIMSEEEYEYNQEKQALVETGLIYERVDNYALVVTHYMSIIADGEFNHAVFYKRLCLCLEELKDYNREMKAIELYYRSKPVDRTLECDEWFHAKRVWGESRLKSSLDYYFK